MPSLSEARRLVLAHGWNTTCYQILSPGIAHWFSARGDAVVGFVRQRGVRVVAGAPVCARERLEAVVREWEASDRRFPVCYFAAERRLYGVLSGRDTHSHVVLGAQPVWTPDSWARAWDGDSGLRAQGARARNKGVRVVEMASSDAARDPGLRRCLDAWLATRGLPPLHFLVEPQTWNRLDDCRVFVARRDGVAVGFVTLSPIPQRRGWLTEHFVRGAGAPNGTVEAMLDAAVRTVGAEGARMVTLGMAPLAFRGFDAPGGNPWWLRTTLAWARAHGRRFYRFDGLEAFKAKFHPDYWEPIYAIASGPRFAPRNLAAIGAAFTSGRPVEALARGLGRALAQEARTLLGIMPSP